MTFGEKLKEARKNVGLSQEQLAEKLCVSRAAVAKWETDRGMPDVSNLKTMAQLLGVSVDYLLDDGEKLSLNEVREPIDLSQYQKGGKCRSRQDAACLAKFPNADAIYPLIRTKKLSTAEWFLDFFTLPGVIQLADYADDNSAYYLVEQAGRQYLVNVTKECFITSELTSKVDPKKFFIGKNRFQKAVYQLL